jgi:hypothetical protein
MAEIEAAVQPDGVADDLSWEAMATIQGGVDGHRPILPGQRLANLSTPWMAPWVTAAHRGLRDMAN